ncbi:MAG TPA: hypothetical protein VGD15_02915 [Kribbella sp.]|jgi:hypothetical protein
MPQAACPFCFHRVDTSRLAYQCTNSKGICEPENDDMRKELTKIEETSFHTFLAVVPRGGDAECPNCTAITRRRACSACHTAVPYDFVDSSSPMVGILGSKGSGKTVYMTATGKRIRETVGKRFGASVRIAIDNPDRYESSKAYYEGHENPIFKNGDLPFKTNEAKAEPRRPVPLLWQGQRKNALGRMTPYSTVLSFVDTAGEDLNRIEDAYTLRYIMASDALVIALDPFALPGAADTIHLPPEAVQDTEPADVLGRVTEILRTELKVKRGKKIKVPLAVVFTKMDAFFPTLDRNSPIRATAPEGAWYDEADGQAVHEHMKALLFQWGAGDIHTHLELNYSDFRFFGVSSLGAEPDYALRKVAPGGVRPHRVEDPILWVLSKEGAVASK